MEGNSTRLWQIRLGHAGLDYLQALSKQRLLEGALICNLKFGEHCVLDKKTKVKFSTVIHCSKGLLDCIHVDVWGYTKIASLGGHRYCHFIDDLSRYCWVYPMRQKFEVLDLFVK